MSDDMQDGTNDITPIDAPRKRRKRGKRGGKKHRKAPRRVVEIAPLPIATVTPRLLSALTVANQRVAHA